MVHERFTGERSAASGSDQGATSVIAHPECPPDVLAEADFVGSTYGMQTWVTENQPARVMMITECSMADNVAEYAPKPSFCAPAISVPI